MTTENKQNRIKKQKELWDAFLKRWPIEKLKELTLEQYVSTDDQDTFTYWLETKTRPIGSIQGNTSAKFGIYKRNGEGKEQNGIAHGDIYTWRTRYGGDENQVFSYVRQALIKIVDAVKDGDLEAIDDVDLAPMVKWKVAFLYQDQNNPVLINTFFKPRLEILTASDNGASFPEMYRKLVEMKGEEELLEFGVKCWEIVHQKQKEIEKRSILNQFLHVKSFQKNLPDWSDETIETFCSIVSDAHKNSLDVFTTEMTDRAMIRVGRKELGAEKAKSVFGLFTPTDQGIKFEFTGQFIENFDVEDVCNELYQHLCQSKKFVEFKKLFSVKRKPYWPSDYLDNDNENPDDNDETGKDELMLNQPSLNQILYGPPGTGKTYHTIEAAVHAAEPEFTWDTREELKAEYDRLVSEMRIRFVTFHQSYGYEEFVEGLTAEATEDKQIVYRVKDGVFKTICDDASVSEKQVSSQIKSSGRVWKLSIEGTHKNEAKTYCFEHNMGAIGWCETGDLSSGDKNDYFLKRGPNDQNSLLYFSHEMTKGDLVLCIDSATSVEAVGVVIGDYQYIESGVPSRNDFCHQRAIKWLAKGFSVDFKSINDNTQFSQPTCYPLWRLSVNDVLSHLQANGVDISEFGAEKNKPRKNNYVLIIDEINRGNISKIFGELITLIEPSKRTGASETLELMLPNSGKPFSVPDNLFLIGTMNTADRSLAMMDTALRRRFDFVEMMPKPELLAGNDGVKGIDLQRLLEVVNQRIEILYDREHTLGHAFFMPVKELVDVGDEDQAFSALVSVFQNKIIPLLEEYFFDDWSKIRLVLADNQKKSKELQFVSEHVQNTQQLNQLFGNNHELEQYGQSITKYTLADNEADVWNKPESYIGIYTTLVSSAE
ncbi:AAA family ATPase [Vibrio parahaemolyticus]|nr:AAA family ATPase [Vibrio parahaemolyticus]